MSSLSRIYLDNAATSWPKPEAVYHAVDQFQRSAGGSAGRGGHRAAMDAQAVVDRARRGIARLIGARAANSIALVFNGTDALNAAIHGVLRPGDHVVTTVCDHNSVLRPLRHAEKHRSCRITMVDCDDQGIVKASDVLAAVRPETRLVALTHASNVTGAIQPVGEVGRALRDSDTLVLADGAQSVGHFPVDVEQLGIDLLAASGHKGLLGPTGTGFLYVRPGVEQGLVPFRQGGTGSQSESDRHPEEMPTRLECGNHNAVGLAGLAAGIEFIQGRGIDSLREHELRITDRLLQGLHQIEGCVVHGPRDADRRVGVVSATLPGYDPHELAAMLEVTAGVQCRAGLHCAPAMQRRLGTIDGGTLRLSPGWATTNDQIDQTLAALQSLLIATAG